MDGAVKLYEPNISYTDNDVPKSTEGGITVPIEVQLLSVIPPQSINVLPERLKKYYNTRPEGKTPAQLEASMKLSPLFPIDISIDYSFAEEDFHAIALIELMDVDEIQAAITSDILGETDTVRTSINSYIDENKIPKKKPIVQHITSQDSKNEIDRMYTFESLPPQERRNHWKSLPFLM